jgi:hypothetical protein
MEDGKWIHKVLACRKYLRDCARFCKDHLEDAIHVLFVCYHAPLVVIRDVLYQKLFPTHTELHGVYSDLGPFFKDLLVKEKIFGLLGKLAYEIFKVLYSQPMLEINPALYTGENLPRLPLTSV